MYIYEDDVLFHYGTPRHSGRYPWGSGENPYQHTEGIDFLKTYRTVQKDIEQETGRKARESEMAYRMNMSTTEFRRYRTLYRNEERAANRARCIQMSNHGYSVKEISEKTGIPSRSVDMYLSDAYGEKLKSQQNTVDELRVFAEKTPYLDVGEGVANQLGVSEKKLDNAITYLCENEDYHIEKVHINQATNPGKYTTVKVLVKDGVDNHEVFSHRDEIKAPLGVYSNDDGRTFENIKPPISINSKRIMVNYAETGGDKKDGVIEIRRGVPDLSLGQNNYAQVRIAVDDSHYLKGMALYSDDLPDGVDIRFNTSKSSDVPIMGSKDNTVLKPLKDEQDNPFGSTVRQRNYIGEDGKEHQSAINIVNDDSDWGKWSKTIASQVLSKQSPELAKKQLGIVYDNEKEYYKDIQKITVPAVKEKMLLNLAGECDSASVDLKAAALPRQATQVILPLSSLKDDEVYAPNFKQGEEIILIRYPHAGSFEVPRLKVNNKNKEGQKLIGNDAIAAIGISASAARKLSGADFDGDTVTAIPVGNVNFKANTTLKGLEDFTETFHEQYKAYDGMKPVGEDGYHRQDQMGRITNLITDMQLKGATEEELARAVKHSEVIIDAEKHNLNWKQSEKDFAIQALKDKYQPKEDPNKPGGGASTLISKSKGVVYVPARTDLHKIDPETGKNLYSEVKPYTKRTARIDGRVQSVYENKFTGELYYTKDTGVKNEYGKTIKEKIPVPAGTNVIEKEKYNTMKSTQMAEHDDAFDLSSGTRMEAVYATHANKLKALANEARKETLTIEYPHVDKEAAKVYSEQVNSLKSKLDIVKSNTPRERQAQAIADKVLQDKFDNGVEDDTKLRQRVITEARSRVGSVSRNPKAKNNIAIYIEDDEWEAIQANAIPTSTLRTILSYSDMDRVRELAIPTERTGLSSAKVSRAKGLLAAGYTQSEVATILGVSVNTLQKEGVLG